MLGETGPKAKSPPCLGCKAKITTRQTCVMCHVCQRWTHPDCSGIPSELVKYLVKTEKQGQAASWSCDNCKVAAEALSNKIAVIHKEVEEMKVDMKGMKEKHKSLEKEVDEIKKRCDEKDRKDSGMKVDIQQSVFHEFRDRDEKKCNFIVHGVPEITDTKWSGYDKKDVDLSWVAAIADTIEVDFDPAEDIKFIRRIGEQKEEKTRPILVGCHKEEKKADMLKNCRKLGDYEDWLGVYIGPDLTKQQRKEEADLLKEMHNRNAELDEDLNMVWRLVGRKGEKRLAYVKKRDQESNKKPDSRNQNKKRHRTPERQEQEKRRRPTEVEEGMETQSEGEMED